MSRAGAWRRLVPGLAALAALAAGCRAPRTAGCEGSTCLPCTAAPCPTVNARLDVEITPPPGASSVRTQIVGVSLGSPAGATFYLPAPVDYALSVLGARGDLLDATLTMTGLARIPGRDPDLLDDFRAAGARSHAARLLPGEYAAVVVPLDPTRPGLATSFVVRPPAGMTVVKEFRCGPYHRLYGRVVSSIANAVRLPGVRVQAFSTTTGLPSTATVSAADGSYEIALPETDDGSFLITATPPEATGPAWGYREVVVLSPGTDRQKDLALEPSAAAARGQARIRIGGKASGFVPIAGASVILTASASAGLPTRFFEVKGVTDAAGYVTIRDASGKRDLTLLATRYAVDVVPPLDSPYARTSTTLDLGSISPLEAPEAQLVLPERIRATAVVQRSDGAPVALASFELSPLAGGARPVEGMTDGTGIMSALVEPGTYLLVIRAAAGAAGPALPPVSTALIVIDGADPRLPDVVLPPGATLRGVVLGQLDARPVARAKVELFTEVPGQAVSLGTATTDASGAFFMVVPEAMGP